MAAESPVTIGDRYKVLCTEQYRLGSGGQGHVFRGRDIINHQDVAVKKLTIRDNVTQRDAERELAVLRSVEHDNVIKLYDVRIEHTVVYLAMEMCRQRDLNSFAKSRIIDDELLVSLAEDVATGIHYLHDEHIVHRDLKPLNILIQDGTASGYCAKVGDFGLAKFFPAYSAAVTATRNIGTPGWHAPEVWSEDGSTVRYNKEVDIFSFALILYSLITQRPGENLRPITENGISIGLLIRARQGTGMSVDLPAIHSPDDDAIRRRIKDLILLMICPDPQQRRHIEDVKNTITNIRVDVRTAASARAYGEKVYHLQQGRDIAAALPPKTRRKLTSLVETTERETRPQPDSVVISLHSHLPWDEQDDLHEFKCDVLNRFGEEVVWGMVIEAFAELQWPIPEGVRLGCIEIILGAMTCGEALALITAVHNGQLKQKLTQILIKHAVDKYYLEVEVAEDEMLLMAIRNTDVKDKEAQMKATSKEMLTFPSGVTPTGVASKQSPTESTAKLYLTDPEAKLFPAEAEEKPSPTEITAKLFSAETETPSPTDTETTPSPKETAEKPSPTETEEKPSPTETYERPSPTETEEKPSPTETEEKPSPTETEEKPSPTETEEKPSPKETEEKPSTTGIAAKPFPAETEEKPSSTETAAKQFPIDPEDTLFLTEEMGASLGHLSPSSQINWETGYVTMAAESPVRIGDRYEVLCTEQYILGSGGHGQVFRGRDIINHQEVAVKRLDMRDNVTQRYVMQELDVLLSVWHNNVIKLYDVRIEHTVRYLVMELCSDGDLNNFARSRIIDDEMLVSLAEDVATGIHYLHDRQIVHRDLKPLNILIQRADSGYCAKVGNLGKANFSPAHSGSEGWHAPEVWCQDGREVRNNKEVDIFSFALILYSLITQRPGEDLRPITVYGTSIGLYIRLLQMHNVPVELPAIHSPDDDVMRRRIKDLILLMICHDPQQRSHIEYVRNTIRSIRADMRTAEQALSRPIQAEDHDTSGRLYDLEQGRDIAAALPPDTRRKLTSLVAKLNLVSDCKVAHTSLQPVAFNSLGDAATRRDDFVFMHCLEERSYRLVGIRHITVGLSHAAPSDSALYVQPGCDKTTHQYSKDTLRESRQFTYPGRLLTVLEPDTLVYREKTSEDSAIIRLYQDGDSITLWAPAGIAWWQWPDLSVCRTTEFIVVASAGRLDVFSLTGEHFTYAIVHGHVSSVSSYGPSQVVVALQDPPELRVFQLPEAREVRRITHTELGLGEEDRLRGVKYSKHGLLHLAVRTYDDDKFSLSVYDIK